MECPNPRCQHGQDENCTNCNSIKSDKNPGIGACTWPDKDNTSLAYTYSEGGIVEVAAGLSAAQDAVAKETMELVGLDRKEAWDKAERAKKRLAELDNEAMRQQIADTCVAGGYWSVWMTVFEGDSDMRQRFIDAMPGTAQDCFDANTQALSRPGGLV